MKKALDKKKRELTRKIVRRDGGVYYVEENRLAQARRYERA